MREQGRPLAERELTYPTPGITRPRDADWPDSLPGFARYERTVSVADVSFEEAVAGLKAWVVKTRAGFAIDAVDGDLAPVAGHNYWITARIGPLTVREPARVVAVVDDPDRYGFAYGTLNGHPVSGEEAFILDRGRRHPTFTLRSLSRPGRGWWAAGYPAVLAAQQVYRRRYLRTWP